MKPTSETFSIGLKLLAKLMIDDVRFSSMPFSRGFISGLHFYMKDKAVYIILTALLGKFFAYIFCS
jgi:hypothetical protein